MSILSRLQYFQRLYQAYLSPQASQLTFWHGKPAVNEGFQPGVLDQYYMAFFQKADYSADLDASGIPVLNYHGKIGRQYNPIAVAQYALGNYNLYKTSGHEARCEKFLSAADWLVERLEKNQQGVRVWFHDFDFEYRQILKAPWYSGLAQGQGISVLVRAFAETGEDRYLEAAAAAYQSLKIPMDQGGVIYTDPAGNPWIEEYILSPPTHILNGFIWAIWGVYDYYLATGSSHAGQLFQSTIKTLKENLHLYDLGFWSLYELSDTKLKMVASMFYHDLHIVQLQVLHQLSGEEIFQEYAVRWQGYQSNSFYRMTAFLLKAAFKVVYY